MLNLKKVIALVCVFALALSTVAFGATYTDVAEDSAYYEAVETLNKLGIVNGYEDGTFKPEDGVTRAEMAKLIACIQGYGETAKGAANTAFTDVPSSHWASGYIANAAGMGIINGYGDGTFGPEDPVKYEQAVKMVMATLGYTPFAEKNGGYPTGWLAAAQRYDVSLAVANAAVGQDANRGTVAQLLENALDTPLMVQSKWNTNGEVEYEIADGKDKRDYKTLMSENLGYVKIRGVVIDADGIALDSEGEITIDPTPSTGKDKGPGIWIDVQDAYKTNNSDFYDNNGNLKSTADQTYYTGSMDIDEAEYLGRSVIGYAKKDAMDDYQLVSIAIDTNRDDTLVIDLDSYAGISAGKISYVREGANDTTEVSFSGSVVYNNVCISDGTLGGTPNATAFNNVIPVTPGNPCLYGGTITLIDNDENNGYDVAIIEASATAVVKKVTEDMVAFKTGTTLSNGNVMAGIELGREDKIVEIYKDGELIDAAELNEWDVLSVIANKDNSTIIVAEVVTNQIIGTVTSTKTSKTSATKAYKIEDTWYDVATSAYKAGVNDLEIGVGGTFYIDKYGKIAAFDEDSALAGGAAANYGYVAAVEAKAADFSGDGYAAKVQMVTADGVEVLTLKKNAKINVAVDAVNNTTGAAGADGYNDTWTIDSTGWVAADVVVDITAKEGTVTGTQDTAIEDLVAALNGYVVKYAKNSAGQISEITVAGHDNDKFKVMTTTDNTSAEFDADNSRFTNGGGYVDEDAIVFIIGGFTGGAGNTSIADSKVGTLADLDDENTYTLAAKYADAKADDCNIIVIDADTVATSATSGLAVITEVGDSTNDDGEAIYILSYYVDGELNEGVSSIAKTDLGVALTAGDVVKVKVGSDGLISDIKMVFDFHTDVRTAYNDSTTLVSMATNANDTTTKEIFAGGTVVAYKDSSTLATIYTDYVSGTDGNKEYKLSQAENVYVIDGTGLNMTVKVGSDANFRAFEKLYDGTTNVKVYLDDVVVPGNTGTTDLDTDGDGTADAQSLTTVAAAQAYADHVYVRAYEGKVKDVIIVKTDADLRIK